jgi:hypothetical protein
MTRIFSSKALSIRGVLVLPKSSRSDILYSAGNRAENQWILPNRHLSGFITAQQSGVSVDER